MTRTCAFLTMESLDGLVSDDELVYGPLADRGWRVVSVPWRRSGVDWGGFDLVLIRTTWDYHRDPDTFLATLAAIDRSPAPLLNPLPLVRWNLHKTYLRDLESQGVPIVPSLWGEAPTAETLAERFGALDAREIVLKPAVSAGARDTFRLRRDEAPEALAEACAAIAGRDYLVQPFLDGVAEEGEFSVFFFAGAYSHAILKRPKPGDFRVQEEHGGKLAPVTPEPALLNRARQIVESLSPRPFQARVDLVRGPDGRFLLMELELIEPSLYFRLDAGSPARFAAALDAWMASR